jgi:hypothetical protein
VVGCRGTVIDEFLKAVLLHELKALPIEGPLGLFEKEKRGKE